MSGNDDQGAPKPSKNPLFDDPEAPPPARVRPRRAKPPPNIISAGGVDMARAHARDIRVRNAPAPERPVDEPKVVVAVETDERKVPTHRKLVEGREAGEERSAMLPEAAPAKLKPSATTTTPSGRAPKDLPAHAPPAAKEEPALPTWMRVAFVLVVLLLAAGIAKRARIYFSQAPEPVATVASPLPIELSAMMAPTPIEATPAPTATAPVAATATATPVVRATRTPPPPSPQKSGFTPPFQLPGEKK